MLIKSIATFYFFIFMLDSDITYDVFEFGFYFLIWIYMKGFWKVSFEMVIMNGNIDCLMLNPTSAYGHENVTIDIKDKEIDTSTPIQKKIMSSLVLLKK